MTTSAVRAPRAASRAEEAVVHDVPVEEVPLAAIDFEDDTFQYRLGVSGADLMRSLGANGQREPIDLTGDEPARVIDGFRRCLGLRRLGETTVAARVHRGISEEAAHRLAYLKNAARKTLSPVEKAHAIYKARKRGRSRQEIASDLGLSDSQLRRYEALLDLSPPLQAAVDGGQISMAHAKVLADANVEDVEAWIRMIPECRWSAAELKRELGSTREQAARGRRRSYISKSRTKLRVYPFQISRSAPRAERRRVIVSLEEAIAFLKEADER